MECYSAINRNKIVPLAEVWMNLESVIQNEVSQKEKKRHCVILLICGVKKKWYR